jgi:hypothetical protein
MMLSLAISVFLGVTAAVVLVANALLIPRLIRTVLDTHAELATLDAAGGVA